MRLIKTLKRWLARSQDNCKEAKAIKAQMEFWHAEETRMLDQLGEAYRKGDTETYEQVGEKLRVARLRRKAEVTDKLHTLE